MLRPRRNASVAATPAREDDAASEYDALMRLLADVHAGAIVSDFVYDDGMTKLYGRNVEALREEKFVEAYRVGMSSGHKFVWPGTDIPVDMPWRAHIACWAASHAANVVGDFVECGVNTGVLSLAICHYVDFNRTGKSFYLFDTFSGIPEEQMKNGERTRGVFENVLYYSADSYEIAARNFSPFPRAQLIRGTVPDSLANVSIDRVSYLSLDMNIVAPEIAALEFFWPKLSSGGVALFDDYGWYEFREQKWAIDEFLSRRKVAVATLPTGQGLVIKP